MFVIKVDNIVDIITNSSSELFIMKSDGKEVLINLIETILPDFRETYCEPKLLKDSDGYHLWLYIFYTFCHKGYTSPRTKEEVSVIEGFTFEEMYYQDKDNFDIKENFIKNNYEKIIKAIDPNNNIWLMLSLDDNPPYEIFEKLLPIGRRIGAI
jgi:hypothetical protein